MRPGIWQIIVIIAVIAILFGGVEKIPKIARSLGRAKGEFKKGLAEDGKDGDSGDKSDGGADRA